LGHREGVWETQEFDGLLLGGIAWAGGSIDADVAPNLSAGAPQANVPPPATN
jgi:hypothetical protein